ncbi:MAG TPA: NAD-dependent epimerase/dehydratase family protein [Dongiaceae bacterium]|nr:NAD-dependent epimerase/dehydratase family protein [Dongiaceae bacterium]
MKVLLTGARGFLGSAVRSTLTGAGLDVIGISRTPAEGLAVVDVERPDAVTRLLGDVRPDVVVNCAARVDFGADVLAGLFPVNVLLPALIGQWCRANGGYLIQASTIAVHGAQVRDAGPAAAIEPDTDYGRSKWLAEQNIDQSGCRAVRLRFGGIFGRSGPQHLGLNRALQGAMKGQPPTLVGQGSARRNYVFVHDAASVVAHCVQSRPEGVRWVGGGQIVSMRQMLDAICEVYLPGSRPATTAGTEAADQIVRHSPDLPAGRDFRAALEYEKAR